jgi:hypothetical protein
MLQAVVEMYPKLVSEAAYFTRIFAPLCGLARQRSFLNVSAADSYKIQYEESMVEYDGI